MEWPQITAIVLLAMEFGLVTASHGKPRNNHNIIVTTISISIWVAILCAGGFFN